ncbi:OmpA family protein [Gracilimonas sp.]|uniref:OmpA family protein n=1 Tax=Gracilimonas sp. TaxID=1974203 RepID=UPI0028714F40|nr:OmpA family protein [Gracilimonas sp.]
MTNLKSLIPNVFLMLAVVFFASCSGSQELLDPSERTLEYLRSLDEETLRGLDTDQDGLNDYLELYEYETNPLMADTDGDGLSDGEEVNEYETDPLNADSDGDGLSDGDEVNSYNTDPLNADSDGDGLSDGDEVNNYNTDPNNSDSDGDGLSDYDEVMTHDTNPNNADSDGDGFTDMQELDMGTNPNDSSDPMYLDSDALETVNFDFDRSNIRSDAEAILMDNVEMLKDAPAFRVRVDAYTDHVGGDQYNLRLSLRRANSVVEFYVDNGISENRIESNGLGKAPVECTEAEQDENTPGCERNRRAESHPISTLKYQPNN